MDRLLLIDGNSILNRAYYAIPPLNSADGKNVNAVYGFTNILLRAISDTGATHAVVAFDMRGVNFRRVIYPQYKANRKGMPDDLAEQMPMLHGLLSAMDIVVCEKAGVEADDIIGTLAKAAPMDCVVLSGDRDLLQLAGEKTTVLLTKKGISDVEYNDGKSVVENYGLTPNQIIEYKALCGDSSDNIPGVSGIGDKGAKNLLAEYGDVDGIYENIDSIKGATRKKLVEGKDSAYLSRLLATIVTDSDVCVDYGKCRLAKVFPAKTRDALSVLGFNAVIKRMEFAEESDSAERTTETITLKRIEDIPSLVKGEEVALDYEKTEDGGVLSFSSDEGTEYVLRVTEEDTGKALGCFSGKKLVVYDGKAVRRIFGKYGLKCGISDELSLMDYIVDYRPSQERSGFSEKYGVNEGASGLFAAREILSGKLISEGTERLYREIELPLSAVLYGMEETGVKVDESVITELGEKYSEETRILTEKAWEYAGGEFNVLSPKQLSDVLFVKLGLPDKGIKKTKTGYSTDAENLEKLAGAHPIVEVILRIRQLSKLKGTYIDGLLSCVKDGFVHTTFNQTQTVTGRLSSSEPNLQNIPVRTDEGREIRRIFVSANGYLVSADYSQIELRLLAGFSGDPVLTAAYARGDDIHALVASQIFGIPQELVTSQMRRTAKAVNFGIIYGISEYGLAQSAHLTAGNARKYIENYFMSYPSIKTYLDGCVENARRDGFVTTVTGRRRMLPEINSKNFRLRSFAERAAMNMPLQGSAADIIKIAMIGVDGEIRKRGLKSRLILQIHDELIVDAFEEELEEVKDILKNTMENAVRLSVPLTVNVSCGRDMNEAK